MSAKAEYKLIVLFDDEIRKAARLLDEFEAANKAGDDDRAAHLVAEALHACLIALAGAGKEDNCILVMSTKPNERGA